MTNKNTPNIFTLLEIDPDQPWDQAYYEQQLIAKRIEWSRVSHLPSERGRRARINLGLISEIKRIATDEGLRNSQAVEARQEYQKRKDEKLRDLNERLDLLQAKGFLLQAEYDELSALFKDILDKIELAKIINVEVRKEMQVTLIRQEKLDVIKIRQINAWLEVLNKTDLYDFLEMPEWTESKMLLQKAVDMHRTVLGHSNKSVEDQGLVELCGNCLVIFKSDRERAKYDEYLRFASYDDLKHKVDLAAKFSKILYRQQLDLILNQTHIKGLDTMETLFVILEYAQEKGYTVRFSTGS